MAPKLLGNEERGRKERGRKEIILAPSFPSYSKVFSYYSALPNSRQSFHTKPPTEGTQVKTSNSRIHLIFTSLLVTFKAAEKNISNTNF